MAIDGDRQLWENSTVVVAPCERRLPTEFVAALALACWQMATKGGREGGREARLRRSVPLIWRKNSCHLLRRASSSSGLLLLLLLLFLRHRRRSKRPRGDGKAARQ